jgi:hypothetical protein
MPEEVVLINNYIVYDLYISIINIFKNPWYLFVLCLFSFGHYIDILSYIFGFWLPIWYAKTFIACLYRVQGIFEDTKDVTRNSKSMKDR